MWTVEEPLFLLFLLLVIPGVFFSHYYRRRGGVIPYPLGIWQGETFGGGSRVVSLLLILTSFFFWAGVAVLILSLAGPIRVTKEPVYLSRGMDILFVLDESPSMASKDFRPFNRFETAKDLMVQFLEGRENDAVGLVTFSGEAALRVPPTVDYDTFESRVKQLELMTLGDGTSLGMGIAVAVLHLQDSRAPEQIIILLTDGESNSGEISPLAAARIASEMGVRIYAVGVGSAGRVPLEYTDPATGRTYRGQYDSGYNEELLKEIAALTGGMYFGAPSPGALDQVFRSIDSLETTEKRILIKAHTTARHRLFIMAGFLLILLSFILRKAILREAL